jgi:hypothetical protein
MIHAYDTQVFSFKNDKWVIEYQTDKQEGLAVRKCDMRKLRFSPDNEISDIAPAYIRKITFQMIKGGRSRVSSSN